MNKFITVNQKSKEVPKEETSRDRTLLGMMPDGTMVYKDPEGFYDYANPKSNRGVFLMKDIPETPTEPLPPKSTAERYEGSDLSALMPLGPEIDDPAQYGEKREPGYYQGQGPSDSWYMPENFVGEFLGQPNETLRQIIYGDSQMQREALLGLSRDITEWAAFMGPPSSGAAAKALMDIKTIGIWGGEKITSTTTGRLMAKKLSQAIPNFREALKGFGDATWEVIASPVTGRELKIGGDVILKKDWSRIKGYTIADIMQPAVERMENVKVGRGTLASTFRKRQAIKQLITSKGEQLGTEARAALSPTGLLQVERAFQTPGLSYPKNTLPEAKQVIEGLRDITKGTGASIEHTKQFQETFIKAWHKKSPLDLTNPKEYKSAARHVREIEKQMTGDPKNWNNDQIQLALKGVIESPDSSNALKATCINLYNLPANTPEAVGKAAKDTSRMQLIDRLNNIPKIVKHEADGDMSDYMLSRIKEFDGVYVKRDVELELRALEDIPKYAHKMFFGKFMPIWKTNKIILRPATHGRNIFSNLILNDIGGLPFYRGDVYFQAMKEIRGNSKLWQKFGQTTGAGGTFTLNEVAQVEAGMKYGASMLDKTLAIYDQAVKPARALYNAEEQMFKFAKYLHNTEKGMSHSEAVWDAMKWTFNYGEVSRATGYLRSTFMPFFTWQSKVLPLMAESMVKNPVRMAKWVGMFYGMQELAISQLNMSEEEWNWTQSILPEYIKEGQFLLLPVRDDKGRLQLLNMTYMIPGFGDISDIKANPGTWLFANPVWSTAGAITTKTKYGGVPLYYDWEEPGTKFLKCLEMAWANFMPAIVPGGVDWQNMYDTATEKPDAMTWEQMIASNAGFRVSPIDVTKSAAMTETVRRIHMQEMGSRRKTEIRNAMGNEKKIEKIVNKYNNLMMDEVKEWGWE